MHVCIRIVSGRRYLCVCINFMCVQLTSASIHPLSRVCVCIRKGGEYICVRLKLIEGLRGLGVCWCSFFFQINCNCNWIAIDIKDVRVRTCTCIHAHACVRIRTYIETRRSIGRLNHCNANEKYANVNTELVYSFKIIFVNSMTGTTTEHGSQASGLQLKKLPSYDICA